tara:strand:+ start:13 stop:444 length:432 start_codon:yes stop_codon:yes gene_type:complete
MIFRHAENKDIISIHNIGQAIFGIHNWSINSIKKYLHQYQNKNIWVYEFKNKIIGYIIEQRCQNEIDLLSIAIDKTFQSKGFGKFFLIKFLQNIPANSSVFLEVKRSNLIAIKLYIDLKFIKISERKNYYHDGEDAILMHYKN